MTVAWAVHSAHALQEEGGQEAGGGNWNAQANWPLAVSDACMMYVCLKLAPAHDNDADDDNDDDDDDG